MYISKRLIRNLYKVINQKKGTHKGKIMLLSFHYDALASLIHTKILIWKCIFAFDLAPFYFSKLLFQPKLLTAQLGAPSNLKSAVELWQRLSFRTDWLGHLWIAFTAALPDRLKKAWDFFWKLKLFDTNPLLSHTVPRHFETVNQRGLTWSGFCLG